MPRSQFDVTNVTEAYLQRKFDEQAALVAEFREAVIHCRPLAMHLLPMLAVEAHKAKATPVMCVQIGLMQGLALGVLMERDRLARLREVVVTDDKKVQ